FFFQAEDGIRDRTVTGVQTCALPILAASTLMMLLPNPKRLMLGYLLGALLTSVSLGLVIVFSLEDSGAVRTTKNTLSPAATMARSEERRVGKECRCRVSGAECGYARV